MGRLLIQFAPPESVPKILNGSDEKKQDAFECVGRARDLQQLCVSCVGNNCPARSLHLCGTWLSTPQSGRLRMKTGPPGLSRFSGSSQ
jgi:hypothetical protein